VSRCLADIAWRCCSTELRDSAGGYGFGLGLFGFRRCSAFAGFGGLHSQGVVEAVEIVEEADGAEELDDFAIVVEGF
jgi:hypothetical protein